MKILQLMILITALGGTARAEETTPREIARLENLGRQRRLVGEALVGVGATLSAGAIGLMAWGLTGCAGAVGGTNDCLISGSVMAGLGVGGLVAGVSYLLQARELRTAALRLRALGVQPVAQGAMAVASVEF